MSDSLEIRLNVLLASRRKDTLDELESALRTRSILRVDRKLIVNGHADPLYGLDTVPDALILHLGDTWQAELQALAERPVDRRPSLIVVGSADNTAVLRLAMQAGARDLLPLPLVEADLIAALIRIDRDHRAATTGVEGNLTAFMNAKGGCGATLLSCNVAHILTALSHKRVALLDLDLQFGAIPLYFDLFPKRGILQALENMEGLDATALEGYMVKHASGLNVLGQAADDALPLQTVGAPALKQLLDVAIRSNDHVIVDLPRRIDPLAATVIERAQQVVLVVQQSVAILRDATRLVNCLRRELGVGKDRIIVAINRYEKNAAITAEDIRNTLGCGELSMIPNDFSTVSECINTGAPLLAHARGAAITKAVMALETRLGGSAALERPSLLARTFASFVKPRSP